MSDKIAISSIKQFNTHLTGLKNKAEALKPIMHGLAMWAAEQTLTHRNTDPMQRLLAEIPGTINASGLAQWIVEFLPCTVNKGEVRVFSEKNPDWLLATKDIPATLAQADETPFFEFHKGTDVSAKPTNFHNEINKLIAKAMVNPGAEGAEELVALFNTFDDERKNDVQKRVDAANKRAAKAE